MKTVTLTKYEASDGRLFDTVAACGIYEIEMGTRDEIGRRLTQRMKDPEFAQWVAEGLALMSRGRPIKEWRKQPPEKRS
jgi:hypothetical protein